MTHDCTSSRVIACGAQYSISSASPTAGNSSVAQHADMRSNAFHANLTIKVCYF